MNKPNNHVRRRGYLATAYDINGEECNFYFKSGGTLEAWRVAAAESDTRNLTLHWIKHVPATEYILLTEEV